MKNDPQPTDSVAESPVDLGEQQADTAPPPSRRSVPAWLALLVLVGLLALAAFLGWAIHGAIYKTETAKLAQIGAVEKLQRQVKKNPRDTLSRLSLAQSLRDSGQLDAALREYDVALQSAPNDVAVLFARATLLSQLARARDAEAAYWAVLARDKGHVRAAEALGDYYASKRQYRSLVKAVRPVVTLHPSEARLQYLMGLAYENLGRADWATARYRLALQVVPGMPEALAGLKRLGQSE